MTAQLQSRAPSVLARLAPAIALCACLVALLGLPRDASAHAYLDRSDPSANAILPTAPPSFTLAFTERLEPDASSAWLVDHTGATIPGTAFQITDPKQMVVTLPSSLSNGTYSIVWKDISADDGHPATGYIPFTIGTAADIQTVNISSVDTDTGAPQWLRTTSRWVAFLGLFACVAVWPVWALAIAPAVRRVPGGMAATAPAMGQIALIALVLGLLGNLFALLVQAMEPGGSYGDALRSTLDDTRYGKLMIARFILLGVHAVLLSFVSWVWPWRKPEIATFAMISSLALIVPFSLIAHASAQDEGRNFSIGGDLVHLAAGSIWAGGAAVLVAILAIARRRLDPQPFRAVVSAAIPRFSMLAIAAWICLIATGAYAAWLEIGSWKALFHTDYGHAFIVKMAVAAIALGFGALHFLLVTKRVRNRSDGSRWAVRFVQTLGLETVAIIGVLLVTGWLTSVPPGREAVANAASSQPDVMEYALSATGTNGTLTLSPGTAGPNDVTLTLDASDIPGDAEALLRLTSPDPSFGQQEFPMTSSGANTWTLTGSQFSVAGDWQVIAIVRKVGAYQWQATTKVNVATPGGMAGMDMGGSEASGSTESTPWHLSDAWIPALALLVIGSLVAGWWIALRRAPDDDADAERGAGLQAGARAGM
jgi:copper transport protein